MVPRPEQISCAPERRALFVDLNNFSLYPTVGVGYIARALRDADWVVDILSPLSYGVRGLTREPRSTLWRHLFNRANQAAAHSSLSVVRGLRDSAAELRRRQFLARCHRVAARVEQALNQSRYDIVLVSAYLMYYPVCQAIGALCQSRGVPLLIGGAYLNQPEVVAEWRGMPGLTALVGGEPERYVADLVDAAARRRPIDGFPGVNLPCGRAGPKPAPARDLDAVPFPDYSGFPWERYPHAIVPILSGRGCGWGACTFCSDITSSSGRTFRSRSPGNVLDEVEWQSRRHRATRFVFTDLKLNSDLSMWFGLVEGMPKRVPDPRWIAAVHVDGNRDNGLSEPDLRAARRAGLVRLTTGLESGSQRVLDAMRKGTDVERSSRFIRDANAAGISVRVTMILGYPGEQAADVAMTARFLEQHEAHLGRVSVNRFQLITGTTVHRQLEKRPEGSPGVALATVNHRLAQIDHSCPSTHSKKYRRAVGDVLNVVHRINRRGLSEGARGFEGVM